MRVNSWCGRGDDKELELRKTQTNDNVECAPSCTTAQPRYASQTAFDLDLQSATPWYTPRRNYPERPSAKKKKMGICYQIDGSVIVSANSVEMLHTAYSAERVGR